MSGARGRPHKIPKSQTYNLTFSIDQVKKVRKRAKKLGVSAPTLIREAVKAYLEDGAIETNILIQSDQPEKPVSSDELSDLGALYCEYLATNVQNITSIPQLASFYSDTFGLGFKEGVEDALEALKKEFTHTKYASGKTLGEVAAEKVRERLEGEKKGDT